MVKQTRTFGHRIAILLIILSGAAFLLLSPVSADPAGITEGKPVVSIAVRGTPSFYWGEQVVLTGVNTDTDSTYLFMTGPNVPGTGGNLSSPNQTVVTGKPDTFTVVKTKPDKSWEYTFYTSGILLDAGSYTLYATNKPVSRDQFGDSTTYGTASIILKKPFITAGISPAPVVKGQAFTITGTAEGNPPAVRIWILGTNVLFNTTTPVNPDASFTFRGDTRFSGTLPEGHYFFFAQHPMADNRFDIVASGDSVRNLKLDNGTDLFRITGPGSLQGGDAADALIAAFRGQVADNKTYTTDVYTVIPFQVAGAGSSPSQAPAVTASAPSETGVTISADGDKSYYQGEKVVLRGHNYDSDTTYLFMTGPTTFMTGPGIPAGGGNLTAPLAEVVSGNPGSFTPVKTNPAKTWEYTWYTSGVTLDAGTYNIYAVSRPDAKDREGTAAAYVKIIVKKPFLAAEISPALVTKGEPFTVNGSAEGNPPTVQLWIIGNNRVFNTTTPVHPDASFTFTGDSQLSGNLPEGQNYLIVQHSMQNNTFDIIASGDYVRSLSLNNGTNIFRISGPGSLQGSDAAEALIAAFSDDNAGDDTYTVIPFLVTDTGIPAPPAQPAATTPVQSPAQPALVPFALIGAVVLVLGIIMYSRR